MNTLREEILHRSPKVFSNIALAVILWLIRYVVLIILDSVNAQFVFLLQMGLLIVSGIFLVRGSFNALIIIDRLIGSLLRRLGIKEDWSRQRIFKDVLCIVAILLVAAAIFPLLNGLSNFEPILQQIITYTALGLILLFVFDIGRSFYRLTEDKANSVADRLSNSISNEEK
jgi:sterol desaturase/sphingolipid hydroxylase (fatty acid hydroxylase superfamily)